MHTTPILASPPGLSRKFVTRHPTSGWPNQTEDLCRQESGHTRWFQASRTDGRADGRVASGFKNHGRNTLTRAVQVQSASTNVNRLSNSWRQLTGIPGSPDLFICEAPQKGLHHHSQKYTRDSPNPLHSYLLRFVRAKSPRRDASFGRMLPLFLRPACPRLAKVAGAPASGAAV